VRRRASRNCFRLLATIAETEALEIDGTRNLNPRGAVRSIQPEAGSDHGFVRCNLVVRVVVQASPGGPHGCHQIVELIRIQSRKGNGSGRLNSLEVLRAAHRVENLFVIIDAPTNAVLGNSVGEIVLLNDDTIIIVGP